MASWLADDADVEPACAGVKSGRGGRRDRRRAGQAWGSTDAFAGRQRLREWAAPTQGKLRIRLVTFSVHLGIGILALLTQAAAAPIRRTKTPSERSPDGAFRQVCPLPQAKVTAGRRRRVIAPIAPKPTSIRPQVAGSGTAAAGMNPFTVAVWLSWKLIEPAV